MKTVVLLACLAVATTADLGDLADLDVLKEEWSLYKTQYGKKYEGDEDAERMKIYLQKRLDIAKHNRQYYQGAVTFKLAPNPFDDLRRDEFLDMLGGANILDANTALDENLRISAFVAVANAVEVTQVDWVMSGAVTEVKNQGRCQCSWAFSATGAIEGQHYRKTGDLVPLSEQNLLDCSRKFGNKGCKGGSVKSAFTYVQKNRGIDTEDAYPYEAVDNMPCRYSAASSGATVTGIVEIASGKEDELKSALVTVGPVSANIDGSLSSFQSYSTGVYYDKECSKTTLNHAVLVVGFGTENGKDYWLVKNSWGTNWGQNGYAKMARNRENACGIASAASYPLV